MIKSHISEWNLKNRRVFLRADLNVPLSNDGIIIDDFRLRSSKKTIDTLLSKGAAVIIATHIGRPHAHEKALSTRHLIPWFTDNGYTIHFSDNIDEIARMHINQKELVLCENLRFFPGEITSDPLFAKQLAQTASYYVNDAFGSMHNYDCSIAVLPYEFSENHHSIGLLVEMELKICDQLMRNPKRPFVLIVGGGKISDKLPFIKRLVALVDVIVLCPALCFSFLQMLGKQVGTSCVDEKSFNLCRHILNDAQLHGVEIIFPIDYQIARDTRQGQLSYVDADVFPSYGYGISIGPKTEQLFNSLIAHAGTIFFNGTMGFVDRPETVHGTQSILRAMASAQGTTIVAGGDTTHIAFNLNIEHKIDYISTGGGATLAYISNPLLPGLLPFEEE